MTTNATLTFPSLSRGGIAYRFHTDLEALHSQAYRTSNMPLGGEHGEYQTYGDGDTQHGPEYPVVAAAFADYCASLGAHLLVLLRGERRELSDEQIDTLVYRNPTRVRYDDDKIEFALTVKYKEQDDKVQYFNLGDRKLRTVSHGKNTLQYDKRWHRVEAWMDGSLDATVRVLTMREDGELAHLYLMERYAIAAKVVEMAGERFTRLEAGRHCLLVGKDESWSPEAHETLRKINDGYTVMARGFAAIDALYNLTRGVEVWRSNLETARRAAEAEEARSKAALGGDLPSEVEAAVDAVKAEG